MRRESLKVYDAHFERIFAQTAAELAQNGKMAIESVHSEGFFHNLKSYILIKSLPWSLIFPPPREEKEKEEGEEEKLRAITTEAADTTVKCKGIPRISRSVLAREHFNLEGVAEGGKPPCVLTAAWRLGSTGGLEMGLSVQSRRIPASVNFKRFTFVREMR